MSRTPDQFQRASETREPAFSRHNPDLKNDDLLSSTALAAVNLMRIDVGRRGAHYSLDQRLGAFLTLLKRRFADEHFSLYGWVG